MNLEQLHNALTRLLDAGHGKAHILDERYADSIPTCYLLKTIEHVTLYDMDGTEYRHGGIRMMWEKESSGEFTDDEFKSEEERRAELRILGCSDEEIDAIERK